MGIEMSQYNSRTDYTYTWASPTLVKKTIKIYGWVHTGTGETATSVDGKSGYNDAWIRCPKLDDEVEV